jgi:hypothetical protein
VNVKNEWSEGTAGIFLTRGHYDDGPNGDNWSYIDRKTLCIVDYRPEKPDEGLCEKPIVLAGPFPSLDAAKAAFLVMYGREV